MILIQGSLFQPNDTITAETGGSERIRIDSTGRLFLNTTTEGNAGADDFTIGQISGSTESQFDQEQLTMVIFIFLMEHLEMMNIEVLFNINMQIILYMLPLML